MEQKHLSLLKATFRQDLNHEDTTVLDIPDDYRFLDPELVEISEGMGF